MTDTTIYEAFGAALDELPTFITDSVAEAGKRTYKYLSLGTICKTIRPIFAKHGIHFTQPVIYKGETERGTLMAAVQTMFFGCGETLTLGAYPVIITGDPQANGSAVTYARRYSLYAALGIYPDKDDDGQMARAQHTQPTGITRSDAEKLVEYCRQRGINPLNVASDVTGQTITKLSMIPAASYAAIVNKCRELAGEIDA